MVTYETIFLSRSLFYNTTWFFPVENYLLKLLKNPGKDSVELPLSEVIRLSFNKDYKKELTLQFTCSISKYFLYFLSKYSVLFS